MEFIETDNGLQLNYNGALIKDTGTLSQRAIFITDDCVIKMDLADSKRITANQTKREVKLYRSLEKEDQKYFAELLDVNIYKTRFVGVFKRYIPDAEATRENWEDVIETACKYGLVENEFDLDYDVEGNWFAVQGNPIIIDYGLQYRL
jgi:hypothetical protein